MAQRDSKNIFVDLIIENEGLINKISGVYSKNNDDFNDLRQEIIYQLWKSFPGFRNESKIQTWMYRVALNTALYYKRSRKEVFTELSEKHEKILENDDSGEKETMYSLMFDAIRKLGKLERAIIFLYLEKCTYEKIAEITGITEKNVGVKLVRIKDTLRKLIGINSKEK